MTGSKTDAGKSAPLWALLLGMVVAAGSAFLLAHLLTDQVKAFAFRVEGAPTRLLTPLIFGEVVAALAIWGVLRLAFRKAWKKQSQGPQAWLAILVITSAIASTFAVLYGVYDARAEAKRVAAAIERREVAAVERAVTAFADEEDARAVNEALYEMRTWAEPVRDFREMSVQRAPDGAWAAVCGEVSFADGKWAGFVSVRKAESYRPRAYLEQDGFDEARRKTCRPLARKYLGIEGVDIKGYMAERDALGCTGIDIAYWQAEKQYCGGGKVGGIVR